MFSKDQQDQNAAMLDMDIQREEMLAFFQEYWKHILGIAVMLVVLTAAMQIYRALDVRAASAQTAQLLPLTEAPATPDNARALETFAKEKASGNRRALALLFAAAKYQIANRPDDVKRVLGRLVDGSAPDSIRDYTRVLLANAGGDATAADKISKNSAWQPAVKELRALAETDAEKRRDLYGELVGDTNTPPALHARAAEFSGQAAQ